MKFTTKLNFIHYIRKVSLLMTELLRINTKLIFYKVFLICIIIFFKSCDDFSDIFPPELAILEPQSDNVKPTFKVKLDVYDNNKIEEVTLILLNEEIDLKKKILRSEPWEHNFTVEESVESFTLVVKATDIVGNYVEKQVLLNLRGVSVTNPNGGENWQAGSSQTITWESANLSGNYVGIDLYKSGNYNNSITSSTYDDGNYSWTIPSSQAGSDYYQVKIFSTVDNSIMDLSNNYFTINEYSSNSSVTVTNPNGGENWQAGSSQTITWESANLSGNYVGIDLYKSGNYNNSITSSTYDDGNYSWTIPSSQAGSDYYQVKIFSTVDNSIMDLSNSYFTIQEITSSNCDTPTGLQTTNITENSAVLNWNPVANSLGYDVKYRVSTGSWYTGSVTTAGADFVDLLSGTSYQWQVQTNCASASSQWSSIISFTTLEGGGGGNGADCSSPHYCSDCEGCEGNCCPNFCSGFYYYYNRSCSDGFCLGATSDYCPDGCDEDGCF